MVPDGRAWRARARRAIALVAILAGAAVVAVSCSREVPGRAPRAKTIAYDPANDPLVNPPELFASYDPEAAELDATNIRRFVSSPTTLNPIFNVLWQDHHLHTMLYTQLIRRKADMDYEWNPEIVESVEESPDHLTFTVHLDPGGALAGRQAVDRARHRVLVRADQRRSRAGAVLQTGGVAPGVRDSARRSHRPVRAPRGDRDAPARHAVPGDREARLRPTGGAAPGPDAARQHVLVPSRPRPRGRQRRLQVRGMEDRRPDRGRALGGLPVHQAAVPASRDQDPARPQRGAAPVQEGPAPRDTALGAAVLDPDQRRRFPARRRQGAGAAADRVVAGVESRGAIRSSPTCACGAR